MKSNVKKIHKNRGGTKRFAKSTISIVLSLLMVVGLFAALPLNVGAVEKENTTTVSETEQSAAEKQVNETKKPVAKKKAKVKNGAKANEMQTGEGETSGNCGDDLTWSYDSSTTTLTISGTGNMSPMFSICPWNDYKENITDIVIESGVTSIGSYAFYKCTILTNVTIPDSVTYIGNDAFSGCTELTNITLSNSLTYIGSSAFSHTGLTAILIPDSVTFIDREAFALTNLATITVDNNNTVYDSRNNCNAIIKTATNELILGCKNTIIPNTVTSIGSRAFYYCTELNSITIPYGISSIGESAFAFCENLLNISFPDTLTSIENQAFYHSGLTSMPTIPNGCSVGDEAFSCCGFSYTDIGENLSYTYDDSTNTVTIRGTGRLGKIDWAEQDIWCIEHLIIENGITTIDNYGLTSDLYNSCEISIPASVTSIGYNYCSGIANITVDSNNSVYDSRNNCNAIIETSTNTLILGSENAVIPNTVVSIGYQSFYSNDINEIIIPNSVTSIDDCAFQGCFNLENIVFGNGVTSIGSNAFNSCENLTSINLPNSLTYLSGFNNCTGLTTVTIPNNVTTIGAAAFTQCANLETIVIPNNVTYLGGMAFSGCTSLSNVTIGNNITSINFDTFKDCSNLSVINIPNNVTDIDRTAFAGCTNATIVLPSSIENLGWLSCWNVNRIAVPVDSTAYNLFTSQNFTRYRSSRTEVVGIVSNDQQFASVFSSGASGKGGLSTSAKAKLPTRAKIKKSTTGLEPVEEQLTEEEIAENLSHIRCYLVDDVKVDESVTFDSENDVVFHLNDFTVNSNGDLVDGAPHTLKGSTSDTLIEVPGNLTIKTTGEGQGGIINESGTVFDVKSGGSLTIENGTYSEDVSEYIADNKVIGKTGNRYTVFNNKTEDLTPENDNHTFTLDNSIEAFERQQLLGVQIRPETDTVTQGMRFVSVVRSDLLRGAKDYGFVLAKGRNVKNMRTNKNNILADSNACLKISAKNTSNSLADTAYSSSNLNEGKYKYLTAAITDIDDDNIGIGARLYIERQDGTYVYADYTCVSTMGEIKAMAA